MTRIFPVVSYDQIVVRIYTNASIAWIFDITNKVTVKINNMDYIVRFVTTKDVKVSIIN